MNNKLKAFNPIPKEHYDISIFRDNIVEIKQEYLDNIEKYRTEICSLNNSIDWMGAIESNRKGELPNKPIKSVLPQEGYTKNYTVDWLLYNNELYDTAEKYFPITSSLIKKCGNIFWASFGSLGPHGNIECHRGTNIENLMRSQWCFIAPENKNCYIGGKRTLDQSDEEFFYYTENSSFCFDDYEWWHWVKNDTNDNRVALLLDYWTNKKYIKTFNSYIPFQLEEGN